jgi:thioredoxin reductase
MLGPRDRGWLHQAGERVSAEASISCPGASASARNVEMGPIHTRVVGGRGATRLESLTLQDNQGQQEEVAAAAVFIMIGAKPHTDWLARSSASTRTTSS